MSSSLKSRLKYILFSLILTLFSLLLILQTAANYFLFKDKYKIVQYLNNNLGYNFKIDNISFNFVQGLHLKGFSIFYTGAKDKTVYFKDTFITVNIIPFILKKFFITTIDINECTFFPRKEKEGINIQVIFSDIYKKISETKSMIPISINSELFIKIKLIYLIYTNEQYQPNGIYLLLKNSKTFINQYGGIKFTSDIKFLCRLPKDNQISKLFKDSDIIQNLKCEMDGRLVEKDLKIDMLFLTINEDGLYGSGSIKDTMERNPYINLSFKPSNISAKNIDFLKNNFDIKGNFLYSQELIGPLGDIKPTINIQFYNCDFNYHPGDTSILTFRDIRGYLEYKNESVKLNNFYLKFNEVPMEINLYSRLSEKTDFVLDVTFLEEFLASKKLPLGKLEFIFKGNMQDRLRGDLEIIALYKRKNNYFDMRLNLKNIDFDFRKQKDKSLSSQIMLLTKESPLKTQKLSFANFKSNIALGQKLLAIKDISFNGYEGNFSGNINLDMENAILNFFLKGEGIDVKELAQDINISNKLLSGTMKVKIYFDNRLKDFLNSTCYIKDAAFNLSSLSDIIKLPPLTNKYFNTMRGCFIITKDSIKVRGLTIRSKDIDLNAYWDTNKEVSGAINTKISAALLNDSIYFKKLIKLTKIKSPYLDFRFLLGGIPEATRFIWMKGEFKERIESALPEWAKKAIEEDLNKIIEEISNK